MEAINSVAIAASADQVWDVLSGQFDDIDVWAARILESDGDPELGELGGRAVVTVEYGPATETLYLRDDEAKTIGYRVAADGMPPMLSDVTTEWRVDAAGGGSVVTQTFRGTLSDPAMAEPLSARFAQGVEPLLAELKHYAETGQPHPNKLAGSRA